jgi:hypothetical protein
MTHLKLTILILCTNLLIPGLASAASHPLVNRDVMTKTIRVHNCEEPTWTVHGNKYRGGLGWLDATWLSYRSPHFPRYMDQATPMQQAWAMAHFVAIAEHGWWPDQVGCTGGY